MLSILNKPDTYRNIEYLISYIKKIQMTYYSINPRLFARLKHNIKNSPAFRKEITHGLVSRQGRLLLTETGMRVLENFNIPHVEYCEKVTA